MTRCKICDVRDYETASLCAELGADFIGIHAIHGIKAERRETLLEISERMPDEWPSVGVVLVTLETSVGSIAEMVKALRPSHLQLHADSWSGDSILRLREYLSRECGGDPIYFIAVARVPSVAMEHFEDLCSHADFMLLDRTHYAKGEQAPTVPPEGYKPFVARASELDKRCFLAGGLNPENVAKYIEAVDPWGVDVQTQLEVPGKGGVKDVEKLQAFIAQVRQATSRRKDQGGA